MPQQKHRLFFLLLDEPETVLCTKCNQRLCRPANMTDDLWRANLARFVEKHPLQVKVVVVDCESRVRVNWTVRESVSR